MSGRQRYDGFARLDFFVQRSSNRIVIGVMRRLTWWASIALSMASACTRPVLYYPSPAGAPAPSQAPTASTKANDAESEKSSSANPSLATAAVFGAMSDADYLRSRELVVPVAGANMAHVEDSFGDPRDGERMHRAIDILAPRGTPILAADGGKILRMSTSQLGGISMYTSDTNDRLVYYYAHMDHYNAAMFVGRSIAKGDTIGFVGTTGNAPKDTPHLHFQVMRWPVDGRYWDGEPIDPYEALGGNVRSGASRAFVAPVQQGVAGRKRPQA